MTTYSNIFAWKIPWTEKPGGVQSIHVSKSQTPAHTHTPSYGRAQTNFSASTVLKQTKFSTLKKLVIILEKTEFEKISSI